MDKVTIYVNTCSILECEKPSRKKGWCQGHYSRWVKGAAVDGPLRQKGNQKCSIGKCTSNYFAKGYCQKHYSRHYRNGDPNKVFRIIGNDIERMNQYINREGPLSDKLKSKCWIWVGTRYRNNYGKFYLNGSHKLAHRAVYQLFTGPIPTGMTLDHLCKVKPCVNPVHLEITTIGENVRRAGLHGVAAVNAAKTHCSKGHKYTQQNKIIKKSGGRECRECRRIFNSIDKRMEYANY